MIYKMLGFIFIVILLSGCATALTEQGAKVRLVQTQSEHNCSFVATVTGSNSMGNSTAHDAEGAMNQLRNKAANLGANAVRVINVSTTEAVTTTVGEALNCQF
jgi:uncharacterized protein YbjQ (UPF0145 family)